MRKNEIEKPEEYLTLLKSKKDNFLYHDHPNDGIDIFLDKELEEIGWHASTFEFLNYRTLADFIESNCEGTITFNDHPLGFNGFVEVDDIVKVREQLKSFCIEKIKASDLSDCDEDQQEALEFFNIG